MNCVQGLNWVHPYILCRCDPLPGDILWVWEGRGGTPLAWPGCNVRDAVLKCDCNLVMWSLFACPEHRLRKRCVLIGRGYTVKTVKETEAGRVCSGSTPGSWVSGKPSFIVGVDTAVVCCPRAVTCVDFFSLDSCSSAFWWWFGFLRASVYSDHANPSMLAPCGWYILLLLALNK